MYLFLIPFRFLQFHQSIFNIIPFIITIIYASFISKILILFDIYHFILCFIKSNPSIIINYTTQQSINLPLKTFQFDSMHLY
jgi:hypothetical protein